MQLYTCVLYKITLNFFSFFPWGQNNDRSDYSLVLREKIFNSQKPQGAEELFVMANEAEILPPNESPLLACSKRSDSGERCGVEKAMKSRGGLGREVRDRCKVKGSAKK